MFFTPPQRPRPTGWCVLPVAGGWRDARQVLFQFREMIEGVAEPDEARPDRAQVGGFQRERFEELPDLPDRFAYTFAWLQGHDCERRSTVIRVFGLAFPANASTVPESLSGIRWQRPSRHPTV